MSSESVLNLSFGRLSVSCQNIANSPELRHIISKAKRSRVTIAFVPSPVFWQTIIHLQLEWIARFGTFIVPMLNLQFLDVVRDDHPIIQASIRGDLPILERKLLTLEVSPLCSTMAGWTPLHFAAAYGHLNVCELLIAHGAPPNATGIRGVTPLHLAAHFGRFEIFKALLKAGSDPDEYHENGLNATFEILSNEMASKSPNSADFIKWLFYRQENFLLDTRAKDNSKRGILYHLAYPPGWPEYASPALTYKQKKAIKYVLRDGVKGDELNIHENSILHTACRLRRLDLVEILLLGNCSISTADRRGYTPLHHAVESENLKLVSMLVRHGSDINAKTYDDQRNSMWMWGNYHTPLSLAAKHNCVNMVALLIQQGAGRDDEDVSNAFYVAVKSNSLETVRYLIKHNADQLDLRDCMHMAVYFSSTLLSILHKAGAPVDQRSNGWTPLTAAVKQGREHAVRELIKLGADVDKPNDGWTPLALAAHFGHGTIVDSLLAAGAKPGMTDSQQLTPWQLAMGSGFRKIADNIARHADTSYNPEPVQPILSGKAGYQNDVMGAPHGVKWDLSAAAINGDQEAVKRLIRQGCSPNTENNFLGHILTLAMCWEHWAIARSLVDIGAELNLSYDDDNRPIMPFMCAVTCYNVAFIELMIQQGADVNLCDKDSSTPLLQGLDLRSLRYRCIKIPCYSIGSMVGVLLSAGAKVNVVDCFGRTPLGKAAAVGDLEAVTLLVEAGADLNQLSSQNVDVSTDEVEEWIFRKPLAWAALNDHEDVVKFLFDSGAEWRSLPKEPALTYTHRLLMQSWFPEDVEASRDAIPGVDLLSIPQRVVVGKYDAAGISEVEN